MKLLCLFGYHKPGLGLSNFNDLLLPGKLDGFHEITTSYKCLSCNKFFNLDSTLEIRDKYNILKRNDLSTDQVAEVKSLLNLNNLTIKEISEKTNISESSIRRLIKKSN